MEPVRNKVALMLGGNIGDTEHYFEAATMLLSKIAGEIELISAVYLTEPWGVTRQAPFKNQAIILSTTMSPARLLEVVKKIESDLGRKKTTVNGPREIDIDILLFDGQVINTPHLTIPHPRLHLRKFNLVPLAEIAPGWMHPVLNRPIRELMVSCDDSLKVYRTDEIE